MRRARFITLSALCAATVSFGNGCSAVAGSVQRAQARTNLTRLNETYRERNEKTYDKVSARVFPGDLRRVFRAAAQALAGTRCKIISAKMSDADGEASDEKPAAFLRAVSARAILGDARETEEFRARIFAEFAACGKKYDFTSRAEANFRRERRIVVSVKEIEPNRCRVKIRMSVAPMSAVLFPSEAHDARADEIFPPLREREYETLWAALTRALFPASEEQTETRYDSASQFDFSATQEIEKRSVSYVVGGIPEDTSAEMLPPAGTRDSRGTLCGADAFDAVSAAEAGTANARAEDGPQNLQPAK